MRGHDGIRASQCRLLTCGEMGAADRAAMAAGVSGLTLMENAGRAVADAATDMTPGLGQVAVLCGPGNNGGDGFVAARYLVRRGRRVRVGLLGERSALKGDAGEMARRWDGATEPLGVDLLDGADLVIDALFGAGLTREIDPEGDIARVFKEIEARGIAVLGVDLPSGLNGDDGAAKGAVLAARRTVTFFRRKPGHLLLPGRRLCGAVQVADIGIPDSVLTGPLGDPSGDTFANDPQLWKREWRSPAVAGHKYDRGHAVVVSGGAEKAGAARLAAEAALRVGAGLVTLALPEGLAGLPGGQVKAVMQSAGQSPARLRQLLSDKRKNAVVIGPGLGLDETAFEQVVTVLESSAAVVLDADALSVAARDPVAAFDRIGANLKRAAVLTPHDGEFKRLFPDIDGSKPARAREAARRSGAVVVLKGADTVIAAPDGRAAINENAPATLATAGTGDVLSGLIGGLLARGMAAFEAAAAGVYIHGAAAGLVGHGLIADDIISTLPRVLDRLEQSTL
jgi:hydroxyethylthiazole kinase-like uncharacterized protein yjeF